MYKPVSSADRRWADLQRQRAIRVCRGYESRLHSERQKELMRALTAMRDKDPLLWDSWIGAYIDESGYLPQWHKSLTMNVGLPHAKDVALRVAPKISVEAGIWEATLATWSAKQMGDLIVSVSGTMKDTLRAIIRQELEADPYAGVEKLTRRVSERFSELDTWQVRRIAQTETMNGLAEAGHEAVESLGIRYTKQWVTSGLENTRDSHKDMHGTIVGQDELFHLPKIEGVVEDCYMRYPHDTMFNPPAGQIINCACDCIEHPI